MRSPQVSDLSIVIVNWNGEALLRKCLQSLHDHADGLSLDIIVVDNHSSDESVNMVCSEFPQVKLIENQDNLGFSKANNQGIDIAKSEHLLLLNSDVFVSSGALRKSLQIFQQKEEEGVGMLGVEMIGKDGRSQILDFYRRPPSWGQILFFYLSLDFFFQRFDFLRKRFWTSARSDSGVVDQVPGAYLLTSKQVLERVGRLDERFFIFFEDADWGVRVREAGMNNYYLSEVTVTHVGSASFAKWGGLKSMRQFFRSLLLFWEKYHGKKSRRLLQFLFLLDSLVLILVGLVALLPTTLFGKGRNVWEKIRGRFTFIFQVLYSNETRILKG